MAQQRSRARREAEAREIYRHKHDWLVTWRIVFGILALAVFVIACDPLASQLAGKTTSVNVTLSITVAITLAVSNTGTALWGGHERKRARMLNERNRRLRDLMRGAGMSDEEIDDGA